MHLTTTAVNGGVVLSLGGQLTSDDLPELRRQLGKASAEARDCVVCEVSDLDTADPLAMTVFATGPVQAEGPGPVICVAGAHDEVADVIKSLELARFLPVTATVSDALEQVQARPPRLSAVKSLIGDASAARLARRFAAEVCEEWGLAALRDSVEQCVSELVTNVVLHARTDLLVRMERTTDRLLVSVKDEELSPVASWWHETDDEELAAGAGYGLAIVRSLATWVGVQSHPAGGKVVWAGFSLSPAAERPPQVRPVRTRITVNAGRGGGIIDGIRWAVAVELRWHPRRPDRVHLRLTSRPKHPALSGAHWDLPRAVLEEGLRRRTRYGDLRLWPEHGGRQLVLEVPGQPVRLLRLSGWRVRQFLSSTGVTA